jgi:hypothetical protein
MNARVESLVEDDNQVREALARTRVEQAQTRRQSWPPAGSCGRPGASSAGGCGRSTPAGAPSTLGQLLGAEDIHQALVTTRHQEQVVEADRAAIDRVDRLRRQVETRLAAQRRYHQRLTRRLRRAVEWGAMIEAPYSGASVRIASIGRGDYLGAVRPTG